MKPPQAASVSSTLSQSSSSLRTDTVPAIIIVVMTYLETSRIGEGKRILEYVTVGVDSAFQANRITLRVPSDAGVIAVAHVVVDSSSRRELSYPTAISPVPSSTGQRATR